MTNASSSRDLLTTKLAEATHHYALKNYPLAAELYAQAADLQAELNGEMAPENADLLYAYGRCLYHVAVGKSDVLGGKVVGTGGGDIPRSKKRKNPAAENGGDKVIDATAEQTVEQKDGASNSVQANSPAKQRDGKDSTPYFQIEGDDADWDSDDPDAGEDVEGEGDANDAPEEEEDDDFATAFEVLDVARVLLIRKLEALTLSLPAGTAKSKQTPSSSESLSITTSLPQARQIQELLADTYDLQAEISLENERFQDAASDSKDSLKLKQQLYPRDSSIVAEAHFKVSLALEFAAKTTMEKTDELAEPVAEDVEGVDEEMRRESARHMELAIESTRLRVERETMELATVEGEEERRRKSRGIEEVREMIADMEQRLTDLRAPTLTLNAALASGLAGDTNNGDAPADSNPLRGILGSLLGQPPAAQRARIEEATRGATDLTGMVRHKRKAEAETAAVTGKAEAAEAVDPALATPTATTTGRIAAATNGSARGKRKRGGAVVDGRKRAKVEDAAEEDELGTS